MSTTEPTTDEKSDEERSKKAAIEEPSQTNDELPDPTTSSVPSANVAADPSSVENASPVIQPATYSTRRKQASPFGLPKTIFSPRNLPIPKSSDEADVDSSDEDKQEQNLDTAEPTVSTESHPVRKRRPPQLPTAATRKMKTRGKKFTLPGSTPDSDDDGEIRRKTRGAVNKSEKASSSSSDSEPEEFLSSSLNLHYPWDSLRLGEVMGSAALNHHLKRAHIDPRKAPRLTAPQVLQMIQSLRMRTIIAPPFSQMHRVVHRDFYDGEDEEPEPDSESLPPSPMQSPGLNAEVPSTPPPDSSSSSRQQVHVPQDDRMTIIMPPPLPPLLLEHLSGLYEFMCDQDVDDGYVTRREVHCLSENSLLDRLRSLENQASDIKVREDQLMKQSRDMELTNFDDVARLLAGYTVLPEEERRTKPPEDELPIAWRY